MVARIFVLCFFICNVLMGQQEKIVLAEWVNEPTKEQLSSSYMFIEFWATWCAPCISVMPYVEKLERATEDNTLFLQLSNEPATKIKNFYQKKNIQPVGAADFESSTVKNFGINTLPSAVLLNSSGEVIWQGKPSDLSVSKLQRLTPSTSAASFEKFIKVMPKKVYAEVEYATFYYGDSTLQIEYRSISESARATFTESNKEIIRGSVADIAARALDLTPSRITTSEELKDKNIEIIAKDIPRDTLQDILYDFLMLELGLNMAVNLEELEMYTLSFENPGFWSDKMYNYGKGDNQYIADGYSVEIDNASLEGLTVILSDLTGREFLNTSPDYKDIHDWNLVYGNISALIEQAKNDYGLIIRKELCAVPYYHISS